MRRFVKLSVAAVTAAVCAVAPVAAQAASDPAPRSGKFHYLTKTVTCKFEAGERGGVSTRVTVVLQIPKDPAKRWARPQTVKVHTNAASRSQVQLAWYAFGSDTIRPIPGVYFAAADSTTTFRTQRPNRVSLGGTVLVQVWNAYHGLCYASVNTPPSWS